MKIFYCLLFSLVSLNAYSQHMTESTGKSMSEKAVCIFDLKPGELTAVDSATVMFHKDSLANLVGNLKACGGNYQFPPTYSDKRIRLAIPGFFRSITYFIGNYSFNIEVHSRGLPKRTIVFSYDFDSSYERHFLTHDNMGFSKTGSVVINGKEIHRFINWDKRLAGTVFFPGGFHVSYFTESRADQSILEDTISKFDW